MSARKLSPLIYNTPSRRLIHELFPHALIIANHFHVVAQAYRALNKTRIHVMNQAGQGSLNGMRLSTSGNYYSHLLVCLIIGTTGSRRNFDRAQLTDVEVVNRLPNFNSNLRQAYQLPRPNFND